MWMHWGKFRFMHPHRMYRATVVNRRKRPIFRLFPLRKAAREWGFRGPHFDSYIRIGCNIFLSIRLATMLYFDSLFAGDEGNRFDSRIHTGYMCLHRSHGLFDSYIPHRVYLFVQVIFRSIYSHISFWFIFPFVAAFHKFILIHIVWAIVFILLMKIVRRIPRP